MNIHRISHKGASPEGTNSTYFMPDRGVIIDPGPPSKDAWEILSEQINQHQSLSSINHILVTHWHADHAGIAPRLAEASDAQLHLHSSDAILVSNYAEERERRLARDEAKLEMWGVPTGAREKVIELDQPSPFPDSYPVEEHEDGDEIAGFEVHYTPGHTLGHAAFSSNGALFVGDAILPTYTPNIGGSDTRLDDALSTYRETLERLRACNSTPYPGHGSRVNIPSRIDEILDHHRDRAENVTAVLEEVGPATPWEVARQLFGEMSGVHLKMGVGEAAAHLWYLESSGEIVHLERSPLKFSVSEQPD